MRSESEAADGPCLVVEMTGLPGSGKSTLAAGLTDALNCQGRPCVIADGGVSAASGRFPRTVRRTAYAAAAAARHPGGTGRALQLLRSSGQQRGVDTSKLLLQWEACLHLRRSAIRARTPVALLEEGLAQAIWSACLRSRLSPADLWATVPGEVLSGVVLALEVDPAVAVDRLTARRSRHSRTQSLAADAALAELRRGVALLEEVLEHCPLPVVRLEADGPLDLVVDAAARRLAAFTR